MYPILASALRSPASGHFWQIGPNPAPAKFLAGLSDMADFNKATVYAECLQLKEMKLILACHRLRFDRLMHSNSQWTELTRRHYMKSYIT